MNSPVVVIHGLWLTPRSWEGWKVQVMTGRVETECAAVATHAGATHLTGDRAGEHVEQ